MDLFSKIPALVTQWSQFNRAGRGGPARIFAIAAIGVSATAIAVRLSSITDPPAPESSVAKMPEVDPLPGGLNSNPAQDALLVRHAQGNAEKALSTGESYTPPLPASVPLTLAKKSRVEEVGLSEPQTPADPPVVIVPEPAPTYVPPETPHDEEPAARIEKTSASEPVPGAEDPQMKQAVADLFRQWDGRPPRTDVVLTPSADIREDSPPRARAAAPASAPAPVQRIAPERVLVPAGRGVYAHTIVSVNSDTGGPIILEADTGPLRGDRMIGVFSRNQGGGSLFGNTDRVVVQVNSLEHQGQSIPVKGLVIAPDSMETAVATSVDQHYIERFALPAAAAFVSGLGQAIALSHSTIGYTPFGGIIQSYNGLNFRDQAGIAGGAAAAQIGQTLTQQMPRGPTVYLAANAGVGVIFLSNVTAPAGAPNVDPANLNTR